MTRNTLIAVVLAVAALSGCGAAAGPTVTVTASGSAAPATPIAQAAAVLARTGAVPTGAVYWSNDEPDTAVCAGGAAEADGTLPASNDDINVCVFPDNAQLVSWVSETWTPDCGCTLIQAGQTTGIQVDNGAGGLGGTSNSPPPASVVNSVASKTSGSVYSG